MEHFEHILINFTLKMFDEYGNHIDDIDDLFNEQNISFTVVQVEG